MLDGCPDWLKKWSVSIYHLMKVEKETLPSKLLPLEDKFGKKLYSSIEMAQVKIGGIFVTHRMKLLVYIIHVYKILLLH